MPHRKRIPANDKVPFERWEMPDLTGVRKRIAQRLDELKEEEQGQEIEEQPPAPPTEEEIAAIREEARQQGYAEGYQQGQETGLTEGREQGFQEGESQGLQAGQEAGYQQGLEQAQHEIDQQLARLQSLIQQLQGPLNQLDQDVEAGLLSLVDLISRALLRREISIDRSFLSDVLKEAVAALPAGHERLRIFINPDDQPLLEALGDELLEDYRIQTDPRITLGGVRVETLQSLVDCTLENRYKKVIDSLLDAEYQQLEQDFAPLPREVLAEPEPTPPREASQPAEPAEVPAPQPQAAEPQEVAEPETEAVAPEDYPVEDYAAPEAAEEPPAEPVAKVSLQRSAAPRHLPPLDEPPSPEIQEPEATAEAATEMMPPEAEPELSAEPEAEPEIEPEPESQLEPESQPEPETQVEAVTDQAQPPLTDEDEDDFFDQMLGELDGGLEADEPTTEPEEASTAAEKKWAPESVHEVRYLEDPDAVMESTWEKDFEEQDAEASGDQESQAADNTGQTFDELLDNDLQSDQDDKHG